jgi:glycosyltransferase involved in cell wall biosynthesis
LPNVSILLPAYNAAATIEAAVRSCLEQTYADFELIVVDDGSTDETLALTETIVANDQRVRIISIPHAGVTTAFNTGLAAANGNYIARMDADDRMHPQKIEKQVLFLEEHPEIGVVSCLVQHGGDAQAQEGYARHIEWVNSLVSPDEIALNRFVESPVCNPTVLFRAELVKKYGGAREGNFPEDYEMWLRWMDHGVRFAKVPKLLFTWNDLPSRLTRNDARYSAEAFERAKTGYLAEFITEMNLRNHRPLFLCGAGRITRRKSDFLVACGLQIGGYIDIDPRKIGRSYNGLPVISLDQLPPAENACVVSYVANRGAREEIRRILEEKEFVEGKDFVMAG